ncbi:MAG: DUF2085 domain-containing protein [Coriobacteriia bacterium]|nr:DUF2085 domain-containing protein [Coriobacteriia bacterium]MBN2839919.1 DUF2085 domain-containing protein [Coriobacteriia bacterium]
MLESFFTLIGYGLCHQLPERSFFAGGYQLPVCARDTGIYLGFVAGLVVLRLLHRQERPSQPPRWPILILLGAFIASMAIDGLTSYSGLRETTNTIRLVTGLLTGWSLAAITVPMLNAQLWVHPGAGRVLDNWKRAIAWLVALVGAYLLTAYVLPYLGLLYPLLVAIAIIVTFVSVNLVLVCLVDRFEGRASRLVDAWPQILIALALTMGELAASAWLRLATERLLA